MQRDAEVAEKQAALEALRSAHTFLRGQLGATFMAAYSLDREVQELTGMVALRDRAVVYTCWSAR